MTLAIIVFAFAFLHYHSITEFSPFPTAFSHSRFCRILAALLTSLSSSSSSAASSSTASSSSSSSSSAAAAAAAAASSSSSSLLAARDHQMQDVSYPLPDAKRRLFISNVGFDVSDDMLIGAFGGYGRLVEGMPLTF
jgi:hypothetical protein